MNSGGTLNMTGGLFIRGEDGYECVCPIKHVDTLDLMRKEDRMVKIFVHKTSGWIKDGCVREFESLEQCLETLNHETGEREYVVEKRKGSIWANGTVPDADWIVEIYDGYRE